MRLQLSVDSAKKKRIQKQGTLTKAEGSKIIAQKDVDEQFEGETRQNRSK